MKQLTSTKMIYFVDESGDPNFLGKENMWVVLEKTKKRFYEKWGATKQENAVMCGYSYAPPYSFTRGGSALRRSLTFERSASVLNKRRLK